MSNTFRTLDGLCRIPSSAPTPRETADHAELAACPFCGLTDSADNATQEAGVSVRPFRSPAGGTACRVECACGASGPSKREDWAAAEAWNRRDPQAARLSEIAALRGERNRWHSAYEIAHDQATANGSAARQAERQRDELRKALEDHDRSAAECRIDGARPQRDTTAPCELCGATQRESCGRKGSAAYAFISTARMLIANQGADQ